MLSVKPKKRPEKVDYGIFNKILNERRRFELLDCDILCPQNILGSSLEDKIRNLIDDYSLLIFHDAQLFSFASYIIQYMFFILTVCLRFLTENIIFM
jgi:hypothetical protein